MFLLVLLTVRGAGAVGEFSELTFDARVGALGEAFATAERDVWASDFQPAALLGMGGLEAGFTLGGWVMGEPVRRLAAGLPLSPDSAFAISRAWVSSYARGYDANGTPTGFLPFALGQEWGLGYARRVGETAVGLHLGYVTDRSTGSSGSTLGVTLGLRRTMDLPLLGRSEVSATARTGGLSFSASAPPLQLRAGFLRETGRWLLMAEASVDPLLSGAYSTLPRFLFHGGGEWRRTFGRTRVMGRLGTRVGEDWGTLGPFLPTLGAGADLPFGPSYVSLDIGFSAYGVLGTTGRFTVTYRHGAAPTEAPSSTPSVTPIPTAPAATRTASATVPPSSSATRTETTTCTATPSPTLTQTVTPAPTLVPIETDAPPEPAGVELVAATATGTPRAPSATPDVRGIGLSFVQPAPERTMLPEAGAGPPPPENLGACFVDGSCVVAYLAPAGQGKGEIRYVVEIAGSGREWTVLEETKATSVQLPAARIGEIARVRVHARRAGIAGSPSAELDLSTGSAASRLVGARSKTSLRFELPAEDVFADDTAAISPDGRALLSNAGRVARSLGAAKLKLVVKRGKGTLTASLKRRFRDARSLAAAEAAGAREVLLAAGLSKARIQASGSAGATGGGEDRVVEIEMLGVAIP